MRIEGEKRKWQTEREKRKLGKKAIKESEKQK